MKKLSLQSYTRLKVIIKIKETHDVSGARVFPYKLTCLKKMRRVALGRIARVWIGIYLEKKVKLIYNIM